MGVIRTGAELLTRGRNLSGSKNLSLAFHLNQWWAVDLVL